MIGIGAEQRRRNVIHGADEVGIENPHQLMLATRVQADRLWQQIDLAGDVFVDIGGERPPRVRIRLQFNLLQLSRQRVQHQIALFGRVGLIAKSGR